MDANDFIRELIKEKKALHEEIYWLKSKLRYVNFLLTENLIVKTFAEDAIYRIVHYDESYDEFINWLKIHVD